MTKRFASLALRYGCLALCCGVFYREFTKYHGFCGQTSLLSLHVHYFTLGMLFFLFLALAENAFGFSAQKTAQLLPFYRAGLNLSALGFLLRGLVQVQNAQPGEFAGALFAGISGFGHILLGVSLVLILMEICKAAGKAGS